MKRFLSVALVILTGISFISCMGSKKIRDNIIISDGWVSPDIYRITAIGTPRPGFSFKFQRKRTARQAAVLSARKAIKEIFLRSYRPGKRSSAHYLSEGDTVASQFDAIINNGTIEKIMYDKDQNCEIIYQVKKEGLRILIEGAY